MIKTEYLNNNTLIKHYSDSGFLLLQNETGIKYPETIDRLPCQYTYTETNELIKKYDRENEEISDEELIRIIEEIL